MLTQSDIVFFSTNGRRVLTAALLWLGFQCLTLGCLKDRCCECLCMLFQEPKHHHWQHNPPINQPNNPSDLLLSCLPHLRSLCPVLTCVPVKHSLFHWNGNVIFTKSSSLTAPKVIKMITFGATNDANFVKKKTQKTQKTFWFQCQLHGCMFHYSWYLYHLQFNELHIKVLH